MGVPYTFGTATTSIPLSNLDANFNTPVTLGNTTVGLGNTVTTVGNLTLTNVTITSGTINAAVVDSGYVANSVVYADSSGVLTAGSANLVFTGTNLGIGTASPATRLDVRCVSDVTQDIAYFSRPDAAVRAKIALDGSGIINFGTSTNHPLAFLSNNTERMRIDSSGSLLVGQTTAAVETGSIVTAKNLEITRTVDSDGAALGQLSWVNNTNAGAGSGTSFVKDVACIKGIMDGTGNNSGGYITFETKADAGSRAERMRITSTGYFKASNNGTYVDVTASGDYHELYNTASNWVVWARNTAASNPYCFRANYSGATPNNTGNQFLYCDDSTALRAEIRSNGGLANYSANNSNLSDRREKTNFAPAKNYLDIICAIPVQTFNYIDQNLEEDDGLTLGVIAQDVQAVAPELVMESNWASKDEPEKMRLSIYQTDLQYALMKAIQELKAELDSVKAELQTLKGN